MNRFLPIAVVALMSLVLGLGGCTPTLLPTPTPHAVQEPSSTMPANYPTPGTVSYQTMTLSDGTVLEYAVVLPATFDPAQTYPILLALPPGGQNRNMVDAGLSGYWADEALARGWIVLSPVAPNGQLFFQGAETLIPEFLDRTAELYRPENGTYHIGGISNGGISAFRIAGLYPVRFRSLLVLPGFPRSEADRENLARLISIPVVMYVGENDTAWVRAMQDAAATLDELGAEVSLTVVPDAGHVIDSLTGAELFDLLDSFR